jgi:hypothetical protein
MAKCGACHHVFNFSESPKEVYSKPEVLMPPGVEMLALLSEISIEYRWRRNVNSFLVFFTIMWNIIVLPMALVMVLSGEVIGLLVMSAHLIVGISLIYYILTMFINKTYITVDRRELRVEHRPLKFPFYPNRVISVHDLKQIYFERYVASRTNNRPDYAFQVIAILHNEERINLLKGLKTQRQGRFIEQEIERFLNIEDQEVAEEW